MPMNNRQPGPAQPYAANQQRQGRPAPQQGRQVPPNVRAQQNRQAPPIAAGARPQQQNVRPVPPQQVPARPAQAPKSPSSKLVLVILALVFSLIGAVLVAVGVFVLKDPAPAALPPAGSYQTQVPAATQPPADAPAQDGGTAPQETAAPAEDNAAPAGTEPAEGPAGENDATEPPAAGGADEQEDAAEDGGVNAGTAARIPSGEGLFMPLASMTTGGDTGGETGPGEAQNAEPTPAADAGPTPAAGPVFTPITEEKESSFGAKQIVTLIGVILVAIGSILALVAGFLQHAAISGMGKQLAALQEKVQSYEYMHREPTFEEKLRYAFEQIPTLTLQEANAAAEPAGAYRPAPVPPPPQPAPPQPVISPAEKADTGYNQLLTQGGQMAAQAMISDGTYSGAGIDINGCLYAYQSGQDTPYRVVSADKGWGVQYFVAGAGSTAPQLYPNPYALEQNGLANAQNLQYILKAFDITVNGVALTPQSIAMVSAGLQIRRVAGARMDAQNTVIQKGQIEMG